MSRYDNSSSPEKAVLWHLNYLHIMRIISLILISIFLVHCKPTEQLPLPEEIDYSVWDNATVYFLLTDRFNDGDPSNNYVHTTENPPAPYRGYMGGDLRGIIDKLNEGYFTDLGVHAIWMSPFVEQIKGSVDEGTGNSFGFHGYWTRDWTAIDPKFGTEDDLKELVKTAHAKGIRVLIDVVANHTGPVTSSDPVWPAEWVKTGPRCQFNSAETTINCTLVENLPDIRTESTDEVDLPPFLIAKWKSEGRYDVEVRELDVWFEDTGYSRTPVNYILKWLVDFIKKYGVDGFRVDTVKHTEADVWSDLWKAAFDAYEIYKSKHSDPILDEDEDFYMVGEVYNYFIKDGRWFDYGDEKVDFFDHGFKSLINFDFKTDAEKDYQTIFNKYDRILQGEMTGKTVLNYIASHDDGSPFDIERERSIEAATKLLLCPGGVQIYYGDESARTLTVEADGDARLRSFMNWDEMDEDEDDTSINRKAILEHWQKLGQFRMHNPSVGAGKHEQISANPYVFKRTLQKKNIENTVLVGLDLSEGTKSIDVDDVFSEGQKVYDAYSETSAVVSNGKVSIDSPYDLVLLQAEKTE